MVNLDSLAVPAAFARHDKIIDTAVLADLHAWKSDTELSLTRLNPLDASTLSIFELADLVRVLAPLTVVAHWSSSVTRGLASSHLATIPSSDRLITHILTQIVKPIFVPTPHPRLHTSTARILPRPADVQDTYIEQPWKDYPGLDEVIRWCLLNTEPSAYETAWPLFLPPVMSFLDDYQIPYKLLGVRLVSDMLSRVPSDLLLRTGVDVLMFTSLINSLSHLGDRSTPDFIRLAVTTILQLIELTTPSVFPSHDIPLRGGEPQTLPTTALTQILSPSQSKSLSTRFSRLSMLLSSSLLGTVIMYTPTFLPPVPSPAPDSDPFADPEHANNDSIHVPEHPLPALTSRERSFNPTLVAAAETLPPVLLALGVGGARFLKGVIPVLAEWLALPLPVVVPGTDGALGDNEGATLYDAGRHDAPKAAATDVALHLASLTSFSVLFRTCATRIEGWSTTIVDALGRCWVGCLDVENQSGDSTVSKDSLRVLKKQLRDTAIQLAATCPGVTKEYAVLLAFDKPLFEGLVGRI